MDAAIEAEVVSLGDSISILFRLINPYPEEKPIWTKKYKEEKTKIFHFFNKFKRNIASEVNLKLNRQEEMLLDEYRKVHPEALEAY